MQTIVDPDEMRLFSGQLEGHGNDVRAALNRLAAEFHELASVWKDEKYGEFESVFEEAKDELLAFAARSEAYAEHLRQKARILDRYLGR